PTIATSTEAGWAAGAQTAPVSTVSTGCSGLPTMNGAVGSRLTSLSVSFFCSEGSEFGGARKPIPPPVRTGSGSKDFHAANVRPKALEELAQWFLSPLPGISLESQE